MVVIEALMAGYMQWDIQLKVECIVISLEDEAAVLRAVSPAAGLSGGR